MTELYKESTFCLSFFPACTVSVKGLGRLDLKPPNSCSSSGSSSSLDILRADFVTRGTDWIFERPFFLGDRPGDNRAFTPAIPSAANKTKEKVFIFVFVHEAQHRKMFLLQ
mmetsp:Transcript_4288/g.5554  ORF Transcript_4288/g.5554 Transcript_4288/m.5554 type:complete len:111 (-) Transcript_4288:26-358(-)